MAGSCLLVASVMTGWLRPLWLVVLRLAAHVSCDRVPLLWPGCLSASQVGQTGRLYEATTERVSLLCAVARPPLLCPAQV